MSKNGNCCLNIRRFRAYIGSEHTSVQSIHRFRAYTGSEHTPVQSIHRFRAYTGSEHTSVQSIHRFRAYTGSEHTPVQSIRRFRAYIGSEETSVQIMERFRDSSIQSMIDNIHFIYTCFLNHTNFSILYADNHAQRKLEHNYSKSFISNQIQ